MTIRHAAALLLATSCTSGPPLSATPDWGWATAEFQPREFDFPERWRSTPPPVGPQAVQVGDEFLLGVVIEDPEDDRTETHFLELRCEDLERVEERNTYDLTNVTWRIRVCDADGDERSEVTVKLFTLEGGLLAATNDESPNAHGKSLLSAGNLVLLVQKTPELSWILWRAVRKPSFLSLLGGIRVSFGFWPKRAVPTGKETRGLPVSAMPFRLNVNSTSALEATLFATETRWPYDATNGIVGLVGIEPGVTPELARRVEVWLIGARQIAPGKTQ